MKLIKKEILKDQYERWDLTVKDHHNYIVEGVVVHNSNGRVGFEMVCNTEADDRITYTEELKAGSMSYKRKMPAVWDLSSNPYWYPWTLPSVVNLLKHYRYILRQEYEGPNLQTRMVTLFGEVYGGSIRGGHKSMDYGTPNNYGFAAYGLEVDNEFIDWDSFYSLCARFKVPIVPVLARTVYNMEILKNLAIGDSILATENGKDQIREGIVIYPVKERRDPKLGRCILKMLNPDYLILKGKREAKGEVVDFKDE